ncbi:AraC family transcriptional regulator [Pendulispora albinea]|uniref:AraC family transcriptional regulator n=1 Tax=Pendulispora albinea TaxID=2741071 RepID=A0ABZ2LR41_9BACT
MSASQFKMLPCAMVGVQAVEAETRHTFQRHTHEQFGVGVIERGAQKSHSGRGMVEAGPGDTITVNPGEVHDGVPLGDGGRAWRILYFNPSWVAEVAGDIREGRAGDCEFSRPVIRDARIAKRFRRLFSAVTREGAVEPSLRMEELSQMLLADVLCEQDVSTGALGLRREAQAVPEAIARARSFIDDDPTGAISLSDLARETGLTRFQIIKGFVRATGLTPHAYIVQQRIHEARRLMADGMPLAEAADASGFADQSHMTRVFVRKYGVSPRIYADAMAGRLRAARR